MEEADNTMVAENGNPPPEATRRRNGARARSLSQTNSIIETEEQKLTIKEPPPLSSEDSGRYLDIQNDDDSANSKSSNASLSSVDTAAAANELLSYNPIAMQSIRDR